jgi:two-component system nitrate/nitrite sensor histidine kinase NarX
MPNASRYGLIGMRERAELIGADFQIISQSDQGTRIRLRLPAILVVEWFGQDQKGASS